MKGKKVILIVVAVILFLCVCLYFLTKQNGLYFNDIQLGGYATKEMKNESNRYTTYKYVYENIYFNVTSDNQITEIYYESTADTNGKVTKGLGDDLKVVLDNKTLNTTDKLIEVFGTNYKDNEELLSYSSDEYSLTIAFDSNKDLRCIHATLK